MSDEMSWISNRYRASRVDFSHPYLIIYANQPPEIVPYTVAAVLARFLPEQSTIVCSLPLTFKALSTTERSDILAYTLDRYKFPLETTRHEITNKLSEEVDSRVVHFVPPLIIVEIDVSTGLTYTRKSLPGKSGGLNLMYYESREEYWQDNS